jgi:hypothetical protein
VRDYQRESLYERIYEVLAGECSARCMDDECDRDATTRAIVDEIERILEDRRFANV